MDVDWVRVAYLVWVYINLVTSPYELILCLIIIILDVFLVILIVFVILRSTIVVKQAEVVVVERFGKYKKTLKPGLHFLIPYADNPRVIHWRYPTVKFGGKSLEVVTKETDRVDTREHVLDFGRQHVITKDTVEITIDALVFYQILDPIRAVYEITNLPDAIELLTQSTIRNIIASMTLDDTFSSREIMNEILKEKTVRDAERWGVVIKRVEIKDILPPRDIKEAMEIQITEERERRSLVLITEGKAEAMVIASKGDAARKVLTAEGQRLARVNDAEGESQAKLLSAKAEAQCIDELRVSLEECGVKATDYLICMHYMDIMKGIVGKDKETEIIMLPSTSLDFIDEMRRMNPEVKS